MITHVAIKYNGRIYSLPAPNRHHHVIRMIGGISGPHIEGFLCDLGLFMDRIAAMRHAMLYDQVLPRTKPGCYKGDELFSEDLW